MSRTIMGQRRGGRPPGESGSRLPVTVKVGPAQQKRSPQRQAGLALEGDQQ
jgi:hypothetical protein